MGKILKLTTDKIEIGGAEYKGKLGFVKVWGSPDPCFDWGFEVEIKQNKKPVTILKYATGKIEELTFKEKLRRCWRILRG